LWWWEEKKISVAQINKNRDERQCYTDNIDWIQEQIPVCS